MSASWLSVLTGFAVTLLWPVEVCRGGQASASTLVTPSMVESSADWMLRPLPDVATLMRQVEEHQKTSESTIRNYLYTSTIHGLKLDGHGDTKREQNLEMEIFYIDGVRLQRMTRKDGRSLTEEEQKKESERIEKAIAQARERRGKGENEARRSQVSFARFLELGAFSNERRVMLHGRSTIALDYTGDAKAKTHNQVEAAVHDMAGTVWVDEEDAALSRVEGHFVNTFRVGGGLVAYVAKDTSFIAESTRVNGEVWLPSTFAAQGTMHVLLFFSFSGRVSGTNTNYRRFKVGSTILPEVREVDSESKDPAAAGTSEPSFPQPH